jgi:hypothetical protein
MWINGQWVDEDKLQGMLYSGVRPTLGSSSTLPFYDQSLFTSPLSTLNKEATGISGMFDVPLGQATTDTIPTLAPVTGINMPTYIQGWSPPVGTEEEINAMMAPFPVSQTDPIVSNQQATGGSIPGYEDITPDFPHAGQTTIDDMIARQDVSYGGKVPDHIGDDPRWYSNPWDSPFQGDDWVDAPQADGPLEILAKRAAVISRHPDIGYPSAIGTTYGDAGVDMNTPFGVQFSGGVPTIEDQALTTPMFSPLDLFGGLPALGKWGAKAVGKVLGKNKKTESFASIKDKLAEDEAKKHGYTSVDAMNKAWKDMGTPDWSGKVTRSSFAQPKGYVNPKDTVHSLAPFAFMDPGEINAALQEEADAKVSEYMAAAEDTQDIMIAGGLPGGGTGGFLKDWVDKIDDARTIGGVKVGVGGSVNAPVITFTTPIKTTGGPTENIPKPPDIRALAAAKAKKQADEQAMLARAAQRLQDDQAAQARQAQVAQAQASAQAQAQQAQAAWDVMRSQLMQGRDRGEPSAREIERAMERATQVDTFGQMTRDASDRASVGIDASGKYSGGPS